MKLSGSFDKFPICAHYAKTFLPDPDTFKATSFNIWNAFLNACMLDVEAADRPNVLPLAREALTMDKGPMVSITSRMQPDEAGVFSSFRGAGYFFKVSTDVANAYEHGTGWIVFEACLLHESIHWVRYQAVGSEKYQWAKDGREVGEVFEQAAYGFSTAQRGSDGKLKQFGPPATLPTIKPRTPLPNAGKVGP